MTKAVKRPPVQWAFVPTGEMWIQLGVSTDTLENWRVSCEKSIDLMYFHQSSQTGQQIQTNLTEYGSYS
jgi:hypothetical protein